MVQFHVAPLPELLLYCRQVMHMLHDACLQDMGLLPQQASQRLQ